MKISFILNKLFNDFLHSFSGTVNSDGTILHGYWFSDKQTNTLIIENIKFGNL